MTSHEPQTHDAAGAEELWLTYLNHDRSVQQAVRRLGALSQDNVELFRTLLLKGRDRRRVKDYEAESIRQLQGEAFVDDEALQTALIVMNAEDPHLGEELKRAVAATGKPENLDRLIADIRAQNGIPAPAPRAKAETPRRAVPPLLIPGEAEPVFENSPAPASAERRSPPPPFEPVIGPAPQALRPQAAEPPRTANPSTTKRVAIAAAILALGIAAMALLTSKLGDSPQQIASVQTPEAAVPQPAAAAPIAAPQPQAAPVMRTSAHEPETPAAPQTIETQPPATQAPETSAMATRANAPAGTSPTPVPVPGTRYTVVRGDMLSQIALQAYKDPAKYPLILRANPNLKHGPDIIYYDQVIFIPPAP